MVDGKTLVGLGFNPSGNDDVAKVKMLFAEIIDILQNDYDKNHGVTEESTYEEYSLSATKAEFVHTAIKEALTAQMWAVKTLTWKTKE